MTRDSFLKTLYRKLKWSITLKQTRSVVHEYCELFDGECALGKSEQDICEKLGAPAQVAAAIMTAQPPHSRRLLLYKILFLAGSALLLFFPIMALRGAVFGLLWPLQEGVRYFYVLLAPLLCIALFRLPYLWKLPLKKAPVAMPVLYGASALTLALWSGCTFFMYYTIVTHPAMPQPHGQMLYTFLVGMLWLIAGIWFLTVLCCDACSRYVPYFYFLFAFCMVSLSNYAQTLSLMSPVSVEAMLTATFGKLLIFFSLAILGGFAWFAYQQKALRTMQLKKQQH